MRIGGFMPGVWLRAVVAVALLLTWLVPGVRLSVSPQERALVAASTELMCLSSVAAAVPAVWRDDAGATPGFTPARATLADAAAPMQRAFDRQWRTDATRVGFVVFAALALLACARRFAGVAALLVIAAATLYWWAYDPHADGYRLLLVTQSLPLWWHAVSQWSWSLQAERLVAPLTLWITLLGACWLLWRTESIRPRRSAQASAARLPTLMTTRGRS
jgi:hypothetical protein